MAKNDTILLDGILDDRVSARLPSDKRDEAFEYLAFEQILKDFDLSSDELLYGSVDGGRDGGIDGFFILVNGHLLQDPESFLWPRASSDLRVVLISSKLHDTFKQATLDSLIATLTELLDFGIEENSLKGAYSSLILRMRSNLIYAYRKLSPRLTNFSIDAYYASRGDTTSIGEEVRARGDQIQKLAADYFGTKNSSLTFVGSAEIVGMHRRIPNYTLELPFTEALSKGERYLVLVQLSDYYRFVTDGGKLRRYLFDSNVRDFMGLNRVNEDIKSTLDDQHSPDFWWLNNGVTVLATAASIVGKAIQMTDIQIVNGLQTTESIFRHFQAIGERKDERCVLVKVIVSTDDVARDAIVRATNNQTSVELASLHATDKIQRDIEEIMLREGLFYERRKNYYSNQGQAPSHIIAPLYVAAGYVALILKEPHRATSLRSKFMRSSEAYDLVFSAGAPIGVWPKIGHIFKRVDAELERLRPEVRGADKFLKGWRYIVGLVLVSEAVGRYTFSASDLLSFDVNYISATSVESVLRELVGISSGSLSSSAWAKRRTVSIACDELATTRNISGKEVFKRSDQAALFYPRASSISLTDEIVERVKAALPKQPWKQGIHRLVTAQAGCTPQEYSAAVDRLIEEGVFLRQIKGVLYDEDGNVVDFDRERVDPELLDVRGRAV